MFAGIPFVSMVCVLPFIVVSTGVGHVFTLLHELNKIIGENIPKVGMLTGCMARAGPIVTMTTLTDLVAFAVGSQSNFPVIHYFCVYAALTTTFTFFLLVTLFLACIWFDIKRINALRMDFLPCLRIRESTGGICGDSLRAYRFDKVMRCWATVLMTGAGKAAACILSVALLAGGIYAAIHLDQGLSPQLLTTKGSHYQSFLNMYEKHFNLRLEISVIVAGRQDYSNPKVQQQYLDLENIAKSNEHFSPVTLSWMSEYLRWAKTNNVSTNGSRFFYPNLQRFLALSEYQTFAQDIKLSENNTGITSSRVIAFSKQSANPEFRKDMMITLRNDLTERSNLDPFPVALPFIDFEQNAMIFKETFKNLIIAATSILVCTLFFLTYPAIVLVLLFGFVALTFELFGLMYIWDVSLNSVSMINLVMALGFSADYSTQVAKHFMSSSAASPELRVVDSIGAIGGQVLLRGLSAILGMLATGFATSVVFQIFFKMFMGIILFSLLNGLIILPVFLSFVGKIFHFHEISNTALTEERIIEKPKRAKKEKSQSRLHAIGTSETVAIVGISCRFAQGVNSKDAFWTMLVEGKCGIGSYPENRLEVIEMKRFYNPGRRAPGKHYTLTGAYLDKISGFDSQFFGISPAECRSLDPQQRLLLQVVYEAIEDAGLRLEDLQQCQTGIYVGLMNLDYGRLLLDNVANIDEFASTGITASATANRISFSLNLTGPSISVDTACSSSLSALNIAITHLKTSQCDVAIVCAPNLILARQFHTACCRTGFLAEDGRCKSFDIKGDGYGRGEGIAAVVLKQSSVALQDRDDAYAEIVACGLNNDGQNAIPITAPSDKMQAELAKRVLQESGLSKDDIQYVEAHGTGTAVGDVVEMRSVSAVYGNSSGRFLRIGSVKSNVNHTESTAGLAGLIKVCLMIKHGYFVPTINVHELKPQLMIPERRMMIQQDYEAWENKNNKPRAAVVCCYGYGGSNGHVIVREIQCRPVPLVPSQIYTSRIMTLTARSAEALKAMAKQFSSWLETKPDDDELLADNLCYTLNNRRTVHSHRLAVTFRLLKQASTLLKTFGEGIPSQQRFIAVGNANAPVKKLAFIYGGQGARWHGMAKEMLEREPKFRESIEKIDDILRSLRVPWSLMQELVKKESMSRVNENPIGQTALFAVHYSLTELLKFWGITPDAVIGHSLGEISAACAVGVITLKEALQLVLLRSQLHESCSPTARMVAISMTPEEATDLIKKLQLEGSVDVAIINSPSSVVLSGNGESVEVIKTHIERNHAGMFCKELGTTRAFHSKEMEHLKKRFMEGIGRIKLKTSRQKMPFYSSVEGTQVAGHRLSGDFWWRNVRRPVLFSSALQNMLSDGYSHFIEINASPQLSRYVAEISTLNQKRAALQGKQVTVISTLPKRSVKEQHMSFLHNCPATLFTCGYPVSWDRIQGSGSKTFTRHPTYPWQEKDYWYREAQPPDHVKPLTETGPVLVNEGSTHPLLGKSVPTKSFSGLHARQSEIDLYHLPYLVDHAFQGSDDSVIPGALYVEMTLALVLHTFPDVIPRVNGITFSNLLTLTTNDVLTLRTRLDTSNTLRKEYAYQITAVEGNGSEIVVSEGDVINDAVQTTKEATNASNLERINSIKLRLEKRPLDIFNSDRTRKGFCFGRQFSLITETWCAESEALCVISPTEEILSTSSSYVVHPAVIDACFQSLFLLKQPVEKPVPYRIGDVIVLQRHLNHPMFCHVKASGNDEGQVHDIVLMDCCGNIALLINGFAMADLSNLRSNLPLHNVAFQICWKPEADPKATRGQKLWLIVPDRRGLAQQFINALPNSEQKVLINLDHAGNHLDVELLDGLGEAISTIQRGDHQRLSVVNFLPVDNSFLTPEWEDFERSHRLAFESSLLLLQAILKKDELASKIQFVMVASESAVLPSDLKEKTSFQEGHSSATFPWSSTLLGFRRAVAQELVAPVTSFVDLPKNPSVDDFQLMATDLRGVDIPEEIVYRNGCRYVNKIERLESEEAKPTKTLPSITSTGDSRPFKLSFVSGSCYLKKTARSKTSADCCEIEVTHVCPVLSTGLTSSSDKAVVCGKEIAHTSQISTEANLIMAICEISEIGNYMVIEKGSTVKLNEVLTGQETASLCFPMAASFYILNKLVSDCEGKTILLYADQDKNACVLACVAMSLGASVTIVTEHPQNKGHLEKFRVAAVLTKDELLIHREFHKLSFDVACFLGKPPSYILQQMTKRVQEGGKVICISNDENERFEMSVARNVVFFNVGVNKIIDNTRNFNQLALSSVNLLASNGYLEKLKILRHSSTSIYDSVIQEPTSDRRSLEQSGLVLHTFTFSSKHAPENAEFLRLPLDSRGLRNEATYLVVGGIRGFGFEVARWMVENGAKTVMCTARSHPDKEKMAEVSRLEKATGSNILLRQADVTSWKDMTSIYHELQSLPNVAGIVFSAMVLEDQRIKDADLETCARVVRTKVQGSVILHQLSLSMDLDFFIMFSSIAGILGNVGQLAYCSANTFLDSLCDYRQHKLGLPALSVDWTTMSGAGILERSTKLANLFKEYGFRQMPCKQGLEFMKDFLCQYPGNPQIAFCDIDWDKYLKSCGPQVRESLRLQLLREEISMSETGLTMEDLARQDPHVRRKTVEDFVRNILSSWTEGESNEVDLNLGLYKYGVDSIGAANMSLQIRNGIGALLEIHYFIQPKTSGLVVINDILQQVESFRETMHSENEENQQECISDSGDLSKNHSSESEALTTSVELKKLEGGGKVIPLYVRDDSTVKVFMMHSSHKSALANAPFAAGFQHQAMVSLYSIGVDGIFPEAGDYGSVRDLAKRYVKLIQAEQSTGPYYLAGFSFGGTLSFEVASQLTEQGEEVAMVAMLDTLGWFPKSLTHSRQFFTNLQELLAINLQDSVPKRFLKSLAATKLGITSEEFEQLVDETKSETNLLTIMRKRADEMNVDLGNLDEQITTLKDQSKGASVAQVDWQPPKVHYQKTITYIRCQNSLQGKRIPSLLRAENSWKCLTSEMDLLLVPGGHLDMLEQPYAEICGYLIATTASMRHLTLTALAHVPQRSLLDERLIDWIKQSVNVSFAVNKDKTLTVGKLWLSEEDASLVLCSEACGLRGQKVISLTDIHNIVPAKYVYALWSKSFKNYDVNLTISFFANRNQQYHIQCLDWKQRDRLMNAFEVLLGTPLLKFNH